MSLSIGIKTDYSLLNSLIKIPDLMKYLVSNNIDSVGILDDNLFKGIISALIAGIIIAYIDNKFNK